jgi:hypothetical protein
MRYVAFGLVLLFAGTANAQVTQATAVAGAGTNVWGGAPRNIVNTPIDTSKTVGMSSNLSKAFKTQTSGSSLMPINLGNMFRSVSLPSFPPQAPQVSVMPQTQNIFQPTPPKGAVNLFNFPKKK